CPSPLNPHCVVAVTALAQATTALYDRQPPCQRATNPTIGVAALAGGRVGRSRPCPWVAAPCGLLPLRVAAPCRGPGCSQSYLASSQAMVDRPCRGPSRGQPPLHADNIHMVAPPPQAAPTFATNHCNKRVE
ncbi:hypothetical protein B296_00037475, partial [Ensete ventricosum]